MVLATKKHCQRVLAASLRAVSAMTGNPPLRKRPLYPVGRGANSWRDGKVKVAGI